MSDYDDSNRGALFKNTRKETDKHPDYRGTINVGGTEYWISSWLKVAKTGEKYMSLSVSEKEDAKPVKKQPSRVPGSDDELDVPF